MDAPSHVNCGRTGPCVWKTGVSVRVSKVIQGVLRLTAKRVTQSHPTQSLQHFVS